MSRGIVIQGSFPNGLSCASSAARTAQPFAASATPAWVQQRIGAHGPPCAVQRSVAPPAAPQHVHPIATRLPPHMTLQCAMHPGQPLPPLVRQKMEAVFRADFRDVRVHLGTDAQNLGATSFAHGTHIHFAPGHYDPHSVRGQQTIGRELAHVLQQRSGRASNPFGGGVAVVHDRALDAEAQRMAQLVGAAPVRQLARGVAIQPAWIRQNGGIVWVERLSARYRITGDTKWLSWWKPREYNELQQVWELAPEAADNDDPLANVYTSDLHLQRRRLSENDIAAIGDMGGLRKLELTNCTFPIRWDTGEWRNLKLSYLCVYSPNTCEVSDAMTGIASMPALRVLRLVRCDFVNTNACYQTLGTLRQLTHLDLTRTITSEKVAGTDRYRTLVDGRTIRQLAPEDVDRTIIRALRKLIRGSLQYLNVESCSALTDDDIQMLVDECHENDCIIVHGRNIRASPEAQLSRLLERLS